MFKRIYASEFKPVIGDYTLNAANGARTGFAVTITNAAAKEVSLANGTADLFILDKEPIPTGINAAYQNMPQSHEDFNTFADGDGVELVKVPAGEVFAVDAEAIVDVNAFVNANYVTANAGKWDAEVNATKYAPTGNFTMVGSTKLYQIMVTE